MNARFKVTRLALIDGLKIRDPFGRYRDQIGYVNPPPDADEVPVEWLEHGIVVSGSQFLPYGSFTADLEARQALCEASDAPEAPEEAEDPSEAPEGPQKAPVVEKKHFRSRQGRK